MEYHDLPIKGKTCKNVSVSGKDTIYFECTDGTRYVMEHQQDCCESVEIEDICGDINDLIGEPLIVAEECSQSVDDDDERLNESSTWTFYRFSTINGAVTIRWLGSSNGYYSEEVSFYEVEYFGEGFCFSDTEPEDAL